MKVQPVPRPASKCPPSGRVTLECGWERPSEVAREITALFKRFAADLGREPYDIDWDRVFALERAGVMALWNARTISDRILVGSLVCVRGTGLFTSKPFTRIEAGYLAPEWRDGSAGFSFIKSLLAKLDGPVEWETNDRFEPDANGRSRLATLLERLRFVQVGTTMRRQ